MATVTELLNRACRLTGLRTTGTERQVVLDALQDAYRRVVMDTELSLVYQDYTFVSSADDYTFTTLLAEQPLKLYHVSFTAQDANQPLTQVSFQELMDLREQNVVAGTPTHYASIGFEGLAFFPNPAVGDVVTIWYVADTPELVESGATAGQETTPSMVPVQWHWQVLLPAVVMEAMQKDQRAEEWQLWERRYEQGIARMQEWIGQFAGEANRAYVRKQSPRWRYNDQRSRF